MYLLIFKACHIIGVIVWFSGLFYLGRLFVYHKEADENEKQNREVLKTQYAMMEKRLYYGITWPGLCITITFGIAMLTEWGIPDWIQLKFGFVILLIGYHFWCGHLRKKLFDEDCNWNSKTFRFFNEIPTLLLVSIVFLVVFKETLTWIFFLLIIVILGVLIVLSVYLLERRRKINLTKKK